MFSCNFYLCISYVIVRHVRTTLSGLLESLLVATNPKNEVTCNVASDKLFASLCIYSRIPLLLLTVQFIDNFFIKDIESSCSCSANTKNIITTTLFYVLCCYGVETKKREKSYNRLTKLTQVTIHDTTHPPESETYLLLRMMMIMIYIPT